MRDAIVPSQVGYLVQISGRPLPEDMLEDCLDDYKLLLESTGEDGSPTYYYKSKITEELNETFGDVLHKIQDLEVLHM